MTSPMTGRGAPRRILRGGAAFLLPASLAATLGGCQPPPLEQNAAALMALQPAHTCTASLPIFGRFPGGPGPTFDIYIPPQGRIAMANDGGWCTISFTHSFRGRPQEIVAPLRVKQPPAHGEAVVGATGGAMRIAYRPAPGYVGPDRFLVRMAAPIIWDIPVEVTVTR